VEDSLKQKRGPNRTWLKKDEYASHATAQEAVFARQIWSKSCSRKTSDGFRVDCRCSAGAYIEGPAGLYLLYYSDNMKIRLDMVTVPVEAKSVTLGQRRKRGQPAKAERALIVP
jgi:hypothetical protein